MQRSLDQNRILSEEVFSPWVIIPAHNESKMISATLGSLLKGVSATETKIDFEIVVVCNGCTDNTAELVRTTYPNVRCEEIEEASKAAAIRHAETLDIGFPRLYLDADIQLPRQGVQNLFSAAQNNSAACLILPVSNTLLDGLSYPVKAYYRVWYQSPFVQKQGFGCGCYLLNRFARERFGIWPDLIADDGFVRKIVKTEETIVVQEAIAEVKAPQKLRELINIKARVKYGNLELKDYFPQQHSRFSLSRLFNKQAWVLRYVCTHFLSVLLYVLINLLSDIRAKRIYRTRRFVWVRDETNR